MIKKTVSISVPADPAYSFNVNISPLDITLQYIEHGGIRDEIHFGSIAEMQEVADAINTACKTYREINRG